jgi:hypothetical protein
MSEQLNCYTGLNSSVKQKNSHVTCPLGAKVSIVTFKLVLVLLVWWMGKVDERKHLPLIAKIASLNFYFKPIPNLNPYLNNHSELMSNLNHSELISNLKDLELIPELNHNLINSE